MPKDNKTEKFTISQNGIGQNIDKFADEIGQEICRQERRALWALTDPPKEDVKLFVPIPIDIEAGPVLSASQATEWLKKTANSKCSSFKKNNAERLFFEFKLDENNYKLFYREYDRVLSEYRGLADYKLLRKALKALDGATPEEGKALRNAILYAANTYINDSSNFVDVSGAVMALRSIKEKGLISYPSIEQIEAFDHELEKQIQEHLKNSQERIKKYFPPDTDFMNMKEGEMEDLLGYEGIKAELELARREYENVKQMSKKLRDFLGRNF